MTESAEESESKNQHEVEQWDGDGWPMWEVHLVYSLMNESPCDECLDVVAPDRETAIEEARRVSKNNPPEVGPTYSDDNVISPRLADNADRFGGAAF